ncbi:MAG: hypothetical protein H5T91_03605 [Synergistetes bacterium]|nr:MAG: Alpha/beta hydrolase family protein [bacterium 42_11]MBC7331499.1 hypothetical protein [Synergistota bacterium]MDK2871163.1 hypothetical protein [bacterium]
MGFRETIMEFEGKIDRFFNARDIVIFGASSGGKEALEILKFLNRSPSYFTDNDRKKWGTEIEGVKVIPPEELKALNPDIIIIGSTVYEDEMVEQIESYGLGDRIVVMDFLELLMVGKVLTKIFEKFKKYCPDDE